MAESFAHKWGQIIGNLFQDSLREVLQEVADRQGLYLDYPRHRPARPGKKVSWQDRQGNWHDLDYVFERGGTDEVKGLPAAFIETAWRRYTKHSRNKAQEIQGAVLALAEAYSHLRPFLGIVLAGVFTPGSLNQLRSCGFAVAHIPYSTIVQAFAAVGIDAAFNEDTPERSFRHKVRQYKALTDKHRQRIKEHLLSADQSPMKEFLAALDASLSRGVLGVTVIVLHGQPRQLVTAADAIAYLKTYADAQGWAAPASRYEIHVRYNTGDVIDACFQNKADAIKFLQTFT
ncbi:MAG TPA: hypothetical protein VNK04_07350 [Gemmataceae bacterium]|nr:hypothetical protein [Gemmataceae bacterium]